MAPPQTVCVVPLILSSLEDKYFFHNQKHTEISASGSKRTLFFEWTLVFESVRTFTIIYSPHSTFWKKIIINLKYIRNPLEDYRLDDIYGVSQK